MNQKEKPEFASLITGFIFSNAGKAGLLALFVHSWSCVGL